MSIAGWRLSGSAPENEMSRAYIRPSFWSRSPILRLLEKCLRVPRAGSRMLKRVSRPKGAGHAAHERSETVLRLQARGSADDGGDEHHDAAGARGGGERRGAQGAALASPRGDARADRKHHACLLRPGLLAQAADVPRHPRT